MTVMGRIFIKMLFVTKLCIYRGTYCNKCKHGDAEVSCNMCKVWWHLDCVGMKRMPRGTWHCSRCKSRTDKAEKKKEQELKRKSHGT